MDHATTALGDFLRTRRARLRPVDLGLPHFGRRRRVPGLRREELAQHAGLSVAYYTRLEQGESRRPSDAVLTALADALRLDAAERAHLGRLARGDRAPVAGRVVSDAEVLRPSVAQLLAAVEGVPALAIGRWTDVLAWNRMAHAVLASHLPFEAPTRAARRPNLAHLVFRDPPTRALYADWARKAHDVVAHLRLAAGEYPDDGGLVALVDQLSAASADFAALWSAHPVRDCTSNAREYRHPVVGPLALTDEFLRLGDATGQRVILLHAEPGSPSAASLERLRAVAAHRDAAVEV